VKVTDRESITAYFGMELITTVKSFLIQVPGFGDPVIEVVPLKKIKNAKKI
jgi:hypothetical protein